MKYSKTTLMELSHKYSSILRKCALLNATVLVGGVLLTTGAMAETIIEGEIDANVLVNPSETTIFNNVTASGIVDPTYDGAVTYIYNGGTATIQGTSSFTSNSSAAAGGVASNAGTLTINDDASFVSNTAPYGGAIYNTKTLTINADSKFTSNTAQYGGALYAHSTGNTTINDATFTGNSATKRGGAIGNKGIMAVTGSVFNGNIATSTDIDNDMGVAAIYNEGTLMVTDSDFTNNVSNALAGSIYNRGTLTVIGGTFEGNSAKQAGALTDGTSSTGGMSITGTKFKNNTADTVGAVGVLARNKTSSFNNVEFTSNHATNGNAGAMFIGARGQLSITNGSIFDSNTATLGGGAIGTRAHSAGDDSEAKLDILNAIFKNNIAGTDGGAIDNYFYNDAADDGYVKVTDTEFTSNSAANGGAIYNHKGATQTGSMYFSGATFTGNTAARDGGAIYNEGTLSILNSRFTGNKVENDTYTVEGGAISNNGGTITISDSSFVGNKAIHQNNSSTHGGAIYNTRGSVTITGSEFIGNESTGAAVSSGGAIQVDGSLDPDAVVNVSNSVFKNNKSSWGGAIQNMGKLTLTNVDFIQNIAEFSDPSSGGVGGALENNVGEATITGGSFSENSAFEGGAIHNRRKITINGVSFTNNSAIEKGGAIVNESTLILTGTNTFSGNKVNGDLNDIHNTGTLNISDALTLDGGISGSGTVIFDSASSLTAKLNSTTIAGSSVTANGAKLNLTIDNGTADGEYAFITSGATDKFTLSENSLYNLAMGDTDGIITLSKKSTDEIVDNLVNEGATAQEAATISAIADTTVDSPVLNKITEVLQTGDVKTAAKAAQDLAPTTSQAVLGISKDVQSLLTNAAVARMANIAGRSGGDVFKGGSMWAQGLYNHTKQDSTAAAEGFKANSKGVAFGIDGKLNDAMTIGLGYGYTRTNADAGNRDVDVDGNNVFAYAEYSPNAWYVNGVLNFGYGRYTEKKSPLGVTMKSKYDVYTYGANLMTGYAFKTGLTPEGGLRYLLVDQKSYNDGVENIKTSNNDVLTAVLGAKYGYAIKAKDWMFTPTVRLAATYDVMSDGSKALASITGGSSYQITGERLHRFGMEAGVGLTSTWNNWDFTMAYDGAFRKDYQSHTGTLKAKYHF